MTRRPFIAGNWKMFTNADEAVELCRAVRDGVEGLAGVDVAVCPPFVHLERVRAALEGSRVQVGAQNCHWEEQGAFTGEVSAPMLRGLVDYVIIGHSERRQYFCETDESANKKLKAVLAGGLTPILCVGETREERESGKTEDVLSRQVRLGLQDVPWSGACVIAYEPVWAIGTGLAATGEEANATIGYIRALVAEVAGLDAAGATRMQYGGSVKPDNAGEFLAQPEIDGALVGGASLDAAAFAAIVTSATETRTQG
jgi:triosephosphate isomerase